MKSRFFFWLLIIVVSAVILGGISLYLIMRSDTVLYRLYYDNKITKVEETIDSDLNHLLSNSKKLASDPVLQKYIDNSDVVATLNLINTEKSSSGIDFIVAINKEGVAISDTDTQRGDYVTMTTAHGRKLVEGAEVATIEKSFIDKMIMVAAVPLPAKNEFRGGIFSGYNLETNNYLFKLKNVLKKNWHYAAYSIDKGVTSSTFNEQDSLLVNKYFNTASDWIQNGETNKTLYINSNYYFVSNIHFESIGKPIGGLLVFMPLSKPLLFIIFLGVIAILVVFTYFILNHVYGRKYIEGKSGIYLITFTIIGIFVLSYITTEISLKQSAEVVYKPSNSLYNSIIFLEPDSSILDASYRSKIAIKISSGGEPVNAVQAILNYDSSKIEVEDVITLNSFCDQEKFLEKTIDPLEGIVKISCVATTPFSDEEGVIAELMIRPINTGSFTLNFGPETQVLAHDGLGTNVLRFATNGSYEITESTNNKNLLVFSATHPNSERWYRDRNVMLSWKKSHATTTYKYVFDQLKDNSDLPFSTTSSNIAINTESDGEFYLHVSESGAGSDEISHFKIKIDTHAPETANVKISSDKLKAGEIARLEFAGKDSLSGLQRYYYVKVDNDNYFPAISPVFVSFNDPGSHTLTVRFFDKAHNFTDRIISVDVTK